MQKKNKFFIGILLLFSFMGFFMFSTFIHEYYHKIDFQDIVKSNEETCILTNKGNAYYDFDYVSSQNKEMREVKKTTEWKAYGIEFILLILYIFMVFSVFFDIRSDRRNYEKQEIN